MALSKQFIKSKSAFKVTFSVPSEVVVDSRKVAVLGDFNGWNPEEAAALKKQKDGSFKGSVELTGGREYQFRYLLDGEKWVNDPEPDGFVPSGVTAEQNCVVVL